MASAAHQADQYYYGVMQAVVVDNEDPLGEGRVRLTYPWLNQSMETEWCRVCQTYAGSGYGSLWVPEKNDEVLVACVHGDLNEAVVLGGLYNGKDKPASKREKAPGLDQKLFRTKGKHQLLLDDSQNDKKIEMKSSAGHSLLLDDKQGQQKAQLNSNGGQSVTLDDQNNKLVIDTGIGQSITMEKTGGAVTISTLAGQSVKLDGTGRCGPKPRTFGQPSARRRFRVRSRRLQSSRGRTPAPPWAGPPGSDGSRPTAGPWCRCDRAPSARRRS
jgi:uncharacterized protein involved in type VI secretion and phage assembly